jgi:CHAT domain-containing protein
VTVERRHSKKKISPRAASWWAGCVLLAMQAPAQVAASVATPAATPVAGKAAFNLGADPTGRVCTARRLFGDPLLRDGRRDFAYDINCGRAGGVGRVYLLGSRSKAQALTDWRDAAAPLCVGPRPQAWNPEGVTAELGLFCAGGTTIGARPAAVLLAASAPRGLLAGDAPPASAPVVERAIRILAGVEGEPAKARSRGPRSALLDDLSTVLGGDLAGGGFGDFASLRAAGFENNSMWQFGSAELQFADAIRIHAGLWPEDHAGRADLQSERALNLSNQRRFAEAERALGEAGQNAEKAGDLFLRGKVAAYSALNALNAGKTADARSRAVRARGLLAEWRRSGQLERAQTDQTVSRLPVSARVTILDSQMLRVLALADTRDKGPEAGRQGLAAAAESASGLDAKAGTWLQSGLAQDRAALELADGRPDAAARLLEQALERYRRSYSGTRVEANLLMDLAAALQAGKRDPEALARYAEAFAIYRDQTENRGVAPIRGMPYLQTLQRRLPRVATPAEAAPLFDAFETLATPAVAQTAAATAARLLAGPDGAVIRAWQDADRAQRRALTRLSNLPADATPDQRQSAEAEVAATRSRAAALQQEVDQRFPKFGMVTLEPVTLDVLRTSLGANERLLRLALGAESGVGMLIDRDQVQVFPVGIGESKAAALVARIKDSVRNPEMAFDRAAARSLFDGLFAEVRDGLLADGAPERLIVDATGALASLPFSVLITGDATAQGEPWLVRRFAVMTVPSMRAFVSARAAGDSKASVPFVGFGDFMPLADAPSSGALTRSVLQAKRLPPGCEAPLAAALARLPPLPGTAAELAAVQRVMGAAGESVLLRERFTDRGVLGSAQVSDARVLMFSTHGFFGTDFPEAAGCIPDAALVTSAVSDKAGLFLDSAQVLDLKLDADLVVLSACDTGNPQPVAPGESGLPSGGDALSGLARSFFYAGARSVMVSHWVLPDADTVALMTVFFERLKDGAAGPEALRAAQIAQIGSGADDPLQWAALTVVGAPQAR